MSGTQAEQPGHRNLAQVLAPKMKQKQPEFRIRSQFTTPFEPKEPSPTRILTNKQRLEIFKQYCPRKISAELQDQDTVLYNPRKQTYSSLDNYDGILPKCQRQIKEQKTIPCDGTEKDRDSAKTNRRLKIFKNNQENQQHLHHAQFLSKTNSQESLVPTQRLRHDQDQPLSKSRHIIQWQRPTCETGSQLSPIKFAYSMVNKESAPKYSGFVPQPQINLNYLDPRASFQSQKVVSKSSHKITFTYQNSQCSAKPTQLPEVERFSSSAIRVERSYNKTFTQHCMPYPATVTSFQKIDRQRSQDKGKSSNPTEFKPKKSIFLTNRDQDRKVGTKAESWGNRIRNQLMGFNDGKIKSRKQASSKTSLMNCKESIIIGEKMDRNNLKINQSFSNISQNQSSKRYYDEDFEFLPQIKKISYNNIDVSRDESFEENEDDFKPNQLLIDLQTQRSLEELEPPVSKIDKSKPVEPILEMLDHQIESPDKPQPVKPRLREKLMPLMLVVLAAMLLLIQVMV